MNRSFLTKKIGGFAKSPLMVAGLWLAAVSQGACGQTLKPVPPTELAVSPSAQKASMPQDVLTTLLGYARSTDPVEQQKLVKALSSAETLEQIDTRQDRIRLPAEKLRLFGIFQALMENPSASAKQTLLTLTRTLNLNDCDDCAELLIKALATVRPAPAEAIRFWDDHSTPDSIYSYFVIDALCRNGSAPAIALLEKKLLDPQQDRDVKVTWLRTSVLHHRYEVPLLQSAERMLTRLPQNLRGNLIEALFDYRPQEWYPSDSRALPPPDRKTASPEAIKLLAKIGRLALERTGLTKKQRDAISKFLRDEKK